jgi:hypothetical protein
MLFFVTSCPPGRYEAEVGPVLIVWGWLMLGVVMSELEGIRSLWCFVRLAAAVAPDGEHF